MWQELYIWVWALLIEQYCLNSVKVGAVVDCYIHVLLSKWVTDRVTPLELDLAKMEQSQILPGLTRWDSLSRKLSSADSCEMGFLAIQILLLTAPLVFGFSFYSSDIHSNETGFLLVGGAKTGISQSVEFWIPGRARSGEESPRVESTLSSKKSIRCPSLPRGMWGHTTDSLPYGQGDAKCPAATIFSPQSKCL